MQRFKRSFILLTCRHLLKGAVRAGVYTGGQGACTNKKLCYTKAMEQRGMERKQICALKGRAERTKRKGLFSSLLFSSLLFSLLMLCAGCTGNGGAANSDGEIYNPDGTPVSSNSAGGGTGGGSSAAGAGSSASGGFTASDLWNRANAGDATGIVQLVSSDTQASPETCTIVFSASDLGLPSGGTARLVIEEIAYDVTASADADGNVTFVVPLIQVGATVTVELSVMDASDTVLWYGSKTQQVGNGDNLEITLESQVSASEVIMKTGSEIKTALVALGATTAPLKTFAASPTPPADGAATQKLSADDSPVEVLAWCDGTSIKYYAAGYTDASPAVKIPLNADSSNMFYLCSKLSSIDLSGFDTGSVTTMNCMFYDCSSLGSLDLSSFDTSSVTDMSCMFSGCEVLTSIIGLSSFDTSSVTDMGFMFASSGLTSLDLSSFDISSVNNIQYMFYQCNVLGTIYVSSTFDTTNITSNAYMFYNCTALVGGAGTTFDPGAIVNDYIYARIDGDGGPGYFTLKP